ncbi:exosortase/archaeosortase family protein [Marinimicrobium sp. ABcell2]|uniref:exosortase/archaeosortase family protein n=1 Tax=Marinimicrobium sp. ABcell2 TaxID=3069751 RepID=UPI0027B800D8|nr:exosortase/archaeosortase family protein [Marinimicrobium sp. ABcell2]MDQ2076186.1 exosortase/archaeosortase family protein [Marinimicrobium sp. ABcell2]
MIIDQSRDSHASLRVRSVLPLALVGAWAVLYASTFTGLFHRWTQWDQDMSYGLPVVAIFIYLLAKTLPWQSHPPSKSLFSLWAGATAVCSLLWFAFHIVGISIFEQLMLLPLLVLALTCLFGVRTVFAHRMLLLLPIFVIPIWGSFNGVLLNISSLVVGELVRLIGMPARIEGNSIFIPYGHILIADGCSGLRYFVISLLLGYLVAYLNRYSEKGLVVVLAAAATIGLVANWLRIFILILIGYRTEMQSSLMTDHETFGWIVFAALCLPALYFAPVVKAPAGKGAEDKAALAEGSQDEAETPNVSALSQPRLMLVLLALAVGPALSLAVDLKPVVRPFESHWDEASSARQATMPVPVTAPARAHTEVALLSSGVRARIDQYQRASEDDKLVPYFSYLYPQNTWLREDRGRVAVQQNAANFSVFQRRNSHTFVAQLQWFEVGSHSATTVPWAKVLQIPAVIAGENHFAIITLQATCGERSCEDSFPQLMAAAQDVMSERSPSQ